MGSFKWTRHSGCWSAILLGLLLVNRAAVSIADEPDKQADRFKGVIAGIKKARSEFKSGVAVISGKLVRNTKVHKLKGPISGLYAFDSDGDQLRYDFAEPHYVRLLSGETFKNVKKEDIRKAIESVEPILFRHRLCYARNRESIANWTHDGPNTRGNLMLLKLDQKLGAVPQIFHMHDVRGAGLFDYRGFDSDLRFPDMLFGIQARQVTKVIEEQDRVVFELGAMRLVVETRDGFRPVELTHSRSPDETENKTKVRWERRGEIDVPVEINLLYDSPRQQFHVEYELKYDWKSVNERVDPVYFDYHSFQNIPASLGVRVIDSRGAKPVLLNDWTGKEEVPLPYVKKQGE